MGSHEAVLCPLPTPVIRWQHNWTGTCIACGSSGGPGDDSGVLGALVERRRLVRIIVFWFKCGNVMIGSCLKPAEESPQLYWNPLIANWSQRRPGYGLGEYHCTETNKDHCIHLLWLQVLHHWPHVGYSQDRGKIILRWDYQLKWKPFAQLQEQKCQQDNLLVISRVPAENEVKKWIVQNRKNQERHGLPINKKSFPRLLTAENYHDIALVTETLLAEYGPTCFHWHITISTKPIRHHKGSF